MFLRTSGKRPLTSWVVCKLQLDVIDDRRTDLADSHVRYNAWSSEVQQGRRQGSVGLTNDPLDCILALIVVLAI
jgi:hypothetical protein